LTRRLAEVLGERGKHDEAPALARTAVDAYLSQQDPSPSSISYAFSTLIETLSNAGKPGESAAEMKKELEWLHRKLSPDDPRLAFALAHTGTVLLRVRLYADADPILRECLDICRKKTFPNKYDQAWLKCTATSMLGEALAEGTQPVHAGTNRQVADTPTSQSTEVTVVGASPRSNTNDHVARLDEAERLLLASYMEIRDMPYVYWPPGISRSDCKRRALERIVQLYEIRHTTEPDKGYDVKAAEWRAKLAEYQATTRPATTQSTVTATQPAANRPTAIEPSRSPMCRPGTNTRDGARDG
jgi:hypothetical protein